MRQARVTLAVTAQILVFPLTDCMAADGLAGRPRHRCCATVVRWRYRWMYIQRYRWKYPQPIRPFVTMRLPAGRVR